MVRNWVHRYYIRCVVSDIMGIRYSERAELRKVMHNFRVAIPPIVRRVLRLHEGDYVVFIVREDIVMLKKARVEY